MLPKIIFVLLITLQVVLSTNLKLPYIVSVRDSNGAYKCSGVIIKPNIILGHGECATGSTLPHMIFAGPANEQAAEIQKIERRIGFFGERYMVLLILDSALEINDNVSTIPILNDDPKEESEAHMIGFNSDVQELRSVNLTISSYDECKSKQNHPRYNHIVACTKTSSKSESCRAFERTGILVCGEYLCGFVLGAHYSCIDGSNEAESAITSYAKTSAFQDWFKEFNLV